MIGRRQELDLAEYSERDQAYKDKANCWPAKLFTSGLYALALPSITAAAALVGPEELRCLFTGATGGLFLLGAVICVVGYRFGQGLNKIISEGSNK